MGKGIQVDAKNLIIASQQDTETYQGKQHNASAQITIGYGASASADYSRSKINAEHASITEQSGIFASEDGYQINIKEHTDLKGGIITSSQSAEDRSNNHFSTGTLTTSDIQNHSHYEGKSLGLGVSGSLSGETLGQGSSNHPSQSHLSTVADKNGVGSNGIGYGNDSDNQESVTRSGINTRNIQITDEAKQQQQTGLTIEESKANIHTTTTTETAQSLSGSLNNIFNRDEVQHELDVQREVTQDFGKNAPNLVATASEKLGKVSEYETIELVKANAEQRLTQTKDIDERINLETTIQQADAYLTANKAAYETWKEGGIGRAVLQAGVGGLMTGNVDGALAGGATSFAAPYLNVVEDKLGAVGSGVLNAVGGAAIGYAVGGNAGAAAVGANVDWHNRQLHDSEIRKIKRIAAQFAKEQNISEQQAVDRLMREAMRSIDKAYADKYSRDDISAESFLRKNTGSFVADGKRFIEFANMGYYDDPSKFAEQHGYSIERGRLYQQPVYTSSQKSAEINRQLNKTISQGIGKGIVNTPSALLNAPIGWINEFTHGQLGTISSAPYVYGYNNEVEAAIGQQTSGAIIKIGSAIVGIKGANSSPVIRYRADRFSTAKPYQSSIPRNLQEQMFAQSIRANPLQGRILRGMNNDSRFPTSAGFQKMEASMTLSTGEKISIHYQYNIKNGRVYDLKFDNRPFNLKNSSDIINNLKNIRN